MGEMPTAKFEVQRIFIERITWATEYPDEEGTKRRGKGGEKRSEGGEGYNKSGGWAYQKFAVQCRLFIV